uniref:ANK_REP_REGION domain-containing protein n=1 Tax=Rhabditophanes sp. KR3021 TaxID=114890 RepID=A0AC35TX29_9BILA
MPNNQNGCNCCPYGYHIDIDFVDFAECVAKGYESKHKKPLSPYSPTDTNQPVYATPFMSPTQEDTNAIIRPTNLAVTSNRSESTTPTKSYFNSGYHSDYGPRLRDGERYGVHRSADKPLPRPSIRSPVRNYKSGYEASHQNTPPSPKTDYFTAVAQTMSQIRSKSSPGTPRFSMPSTETKPNLNPNSAKPPIPPKPYMSNQNSMPNFEAYRSLSPTQPISYRSRSPLISADKDLMGSRNYQYINNKSHLISPDINSNYRLYSNEPTSTSPLSSSAYTTTSKLSSPLDVDNFASMRRRKLNSNNDRAEVFSPASMIGSGCTSPIDLNFYESTRYGTDNRMHLESHHQPRSVVDRIGSSNPHSSLLDSMKERPGVNYQPSPKVSNTIKSPVCELVVKDDVGLDPINECCPLFEAPKLIHNATIAIQTEEEIKAVKKLIHAHVQTMIEKEIEKHHISIQTELETKPLIDINNLSTQTEPEKVIVKATCGTQLPVEEWGCLLISKTEYELLLSKSERLSSLEKEIAEGAMRKAEQQAYQEAEYLKLHAISNAARLESDKAMANAMEAMQMKETEALFRNVEKEFEEEDLEEAEIVSLSHQDQGDELDIINPTPDYSISLNGLSTGSSESDSDNECIKTSKNMNGQRVLYFDGLSSDEEKDLELLEFEQEELNAIKLEQSNRKSKCFDEDEHIISEINEDAIAAIYSETPPQEPYVPKLLSPDKTEAVKKLLTDTQLNTFYRGDSHRSFRVNKSNANDLSVMAERHVHDSGESALPTSAVQDPRAVLAGKIELKKDAAGHNNHLITPPFPISIASAIPLNYQNSIPRPKISRYNIPQEPAQNPEEEAEAVDRVMPLPSEMRQFGLYKDRSHYNDRRMKYITSKQLSSPSRDDDDNSSISSDTSEEFSPDDNSVSEHVIYQIKAPLKEALTLMQKFVENPANVTPDVADWAVKYVKHEWMRLTTKEEADVNGISTLQEYIRQTSLELLKAVVNLCDQNDNTALHFAIANSKFDVVSVLLDAQVCEMNKPNKAGYSAIMIGATTPTKHDAHAAIVDRLFRSGDVNTRSLSHGQTALMLAVSCNNESAVRGLLELGADVNIQDFEGSTALMVVSEHGHDELAKYLLDHPDIDTAIRDCDEQTALSIAVGNKYHSIAGLIYAYNNHTLKKKDNNAQ